MNFYKSCSNLHQWFIRIREIYEDYFLYIFITCVVRKKRKKCLKSSGCNLQNAGRVSLTEKLNV